MLCGFAPNAEVDVGQAVITGKNPSVCVDYSDLHYKVCDYGLFA